jgi:hypothetical protein
MATLRSRPPPAQDDRSATLAIAANASGSSAESRKHIRPSTGRGPEIRQTRVDWWALGARRNASLLVSAQLRGVDGRGLRLFTAVNSLAV